jgi:predicted RNase H-like HicB family nuclease
LAPTPKRQAVSKTAATFQFKNSGPKGKISSVNLKIVIETGEDGYFVAHCPSLKSCWSQGKTREEALKNIREAIDLYLEPSPSELAVINFH